LIYIPWHFPLQFDNTIQGSSERAEKEFCQQYPAVYKHMLQYKKELSARNKAETGIRYEWYALQRWGANYWEDFLKPKIVWGEISDIPKFGFDAKGEMYCEATSFLMVGDDLPFIYLFLNSTICLYQFCKIGTTTGVGTLRWKKYKIQEILVPTEYDKKAVLDLVERILATKHVTNTAALKLKIDSFFYELYGLTEVEIQEIKASCPNLFLNQFQQNQ
ncbi:hypothetical protein, partial [Synergistes jonesii]